MFTSQFLWFSPADYHQSPCDSPDHAAHCHMIGIETGLRTGLESWLKQEIFLVFNKSRPVLGLTQPPIKSVQRFLSREVKRPEREAEVSFQSVIEISGSVAD